MSEATLREACQKAITAWKAWSKTAERLPSPEWIDAMGEIRAALVTSAVQSAAEVIERVRKVAERIAEFLCAHLSNPLQKAECIKYRTDLMSKPFVALVTRERDEARLAFGEKVAKLVEREWFNPDVTGQGCAQAIRALAAKEQP